MGSKPKPPTPPPLPTPTPGTQATVANDAQKAPAKANIAGTQSMYDSGALAPTEKKNKLGGMNLWG